MTGEIELNLILAKLALAESHEEEAEIGRSELASVLFHASPQLLEKVLKLAKRDYRVLRCLSAARYYSGLSEDKCARIDDVIRHPFPAARGPRKRPRK